MKKLMLLFLLTFLLVTPVNATASFTAPSAPEEVEKYMPEDTESFGEGLWHIVKAAMAHLQPSIAEAATICLSLVTVIMLVSILQGFSGNSTQVTHLVGVLMIGILFLKPAHAMISLGTETIFSLSQYGKLLLPVMTAALAAQGGIASSGVLYAGTSVLCAVLTSAISHFLVPLLYIYMCLSVANAAINEEILKKMRDFVKWVMVWSLKILLYFFTGYLTITGVVSGTTDASALKAAKLAISGAVPVVGNILSDASETVLVSAGIMKNAAGIYGMLAMIALWIGPFLQIGIQYLMTKITSAVCSVFGGGTSVSLIEDMSGLMGIVLAMTGTACLLLMVSTVCFMKGIT